MLRHPDHPDLHLLELQDLWSTATFGIPDEMIAPAREIVGWTYDFLSRPHVNLGRKGSVCPFTSASLKQRSFWLSSVAAREMNDIEIEEMLEVFVDWFPTLPPTEDDKAGLRTILIIFSDLDRPEEWARVDEIQDKLKATYVQRGLMLGQFHPAAEQEGLWNPDFRPLRAPYAMLAIRSMVASDWPFLTTPEFLGQYMNRMGDQLPDRDRDTILELCVRHGICPVSGRQMIG